MDICQSRSIKKGRKRGKADGNIGSILWERKKTDIERLLPGFSLFESRYLAWAVGKPPIFDEGKEKLTRQKGRGKGENPRPVDREGRGYVHLLIKARRVLGLLTCEDPRREREVNGLREEKAAGGTEDKSLWLRFDGQKG